MNTPTSKGAAPTATLEERSHTLSSLGLIAEHLSEPLFVKDQAQKFVLVNEAFCDLVRLQRHLLLGHRESNTSDADHGSQAEVAVFDGAPVVRVERAFLTGDGALITCATTHLPLRDEQGSVSHVVAVLRSSPAPSSTAGRASRSHDDRARARKALQQDLLRRERLMVLGQLAAGLAHQIRNPLAEITLSLALTRKHLPADREILHKTLQFADEGVLEANRVITGLLQFAQIRDPKPMAIPLHDVVGAALEEERPPADVTVSVDVPDVDLFVDPQQVRDALRKVIRNAYEAMNGGGELSLSAPATEGAGLLELRIRDSGVGIAEQHRALLFEPMITSKPLGLGLGLATAQALVTHQGGTLECVPMASGACFSMKLPLAAPTSEPVPTTAGRKPQP